MLSGFETYNSYKDSGIDWLGRIPSEWDLLPAMRFIQESKNKNEGMIEEQVLSLSYGNIVKKSSEQLTGLVPESFETYQIVEKGDIIIRGTDLQNDKTSLRTGLSKYRGIITSAYLNLRHKEGVSPKYLHYFFHSMDISKSLYKFGSGLRQNLSFEDFKRMQIPDLEKVQQIAIANFLDDKTEKIDRAIEIKEAQIARLEERKQILIQTAVTRGLDPNVPMKDSGIGWIGGIPAHWDIIATKYILTERSNQVGANWEQFNLLSLTLRGIVLRDMENPEGKFPASFETYQEVRPGDFVFCHFDVQETPRTVGLSKHHGMITGAYTVYESAYEQNDEYLYQVHLMLDSDKKLRPLYKGLRNTVPKDSFGRLEVPLPPLDEQAKIVDYISAVNNIIKVTNANLGCQIQHLKEYRASLINSAVTGKIKIPS